MNDVDMRGWALMRWGIVSIVSEVASEMKREMQRQRYSESYSDERKRERQEARPRRADLHPSRYARRAKT
jgi:hypothetical protein